MVAQLLSGREPLEVQLAGVLGCLEFLPSFYRLDTNSNFAIDSMLLQRVNTLLPSVISTTAREGGLVFCSIRTCQLNGLVPMRRSPAAQDSGTNGILLPS